MFPSLRFRLCREGRGTDTADCEPGNRNIGDLEIGQPGYLRSEIRNLQLDDTAEWGVGAVRRHR